VPKFRNVDPMPPFEPNTVSRTATVPSFTCFRFIVLTYYTPTYTHTHRDKVIAISVPPFYFVGADNKDATTQPWRQILFYKIILKQRWTNV